MKAVVGFTCRRFGFDLVARNGWPHVQASFRAWRTRWELTIWYGLCQDGKRRMLREVRKASW